MSLLALLFMSPSLLAQKTAFISEVQVLRATPGYEQALLEMDSIKVDFHKEIVQWQMLLNEKKGKFFSRYHFDENTPDEVIQGALSEHDLRKWLLLKEESALLEKQIKAKEEEFQYLFNARVGTLVDKVNSIIASFCKRHQIILLYKLEQWQAGLVYIDADLDVTQSIIDEILLNIK